MKRSLSPSLPSTELRPHKKHQSARATPPCSSSSTTKDTPIPTPANGLSAEDDAWLWSEDLEKLDEEDTRLEELKADELEKLLYSTFVQRPHTPYSSSDGFRNALRLCNLVVGVRRNCKYLRVTDSPPYSLFHRTQDHPNYYLMSKNELLTRDIFEKLVHYQKCRDMEMKKILKRYLPLRGEFVKTLGRKPWECGYCKLPIASAVTGCHKAWGRWDSFATTFPYWTRCEQESNGSDVYCLSENKWCKTCVEKECQRVVGMDEAKIKKKFDTLKSLINTFECIKRGAISINGVPTMPPKEFFAKMMELVGDIVEPYSLTQVTQEAYEKTGIAAKERDIEKGFKKWRDERDERLK